MDDPTHLPAEAAPPASIGAGAQADAAVLHASDVRASEDYEATSEGLPTDHKLIVLSCLLVLACLFVASVAAEIVLPIILAFTLKLLFQPPMRLLERIYVPRALAALVLIFAFFGVFVGVGAAVSGPAASWAGRLPDGLPRLEQRLQLLERPIHTLQDFVKQIDGQEIGANLGLSSMVLKGTQHFAGGLFETMLILFFLLISGDTFLRRIVEVLPKFSDKRQVVELSQQVERNISAYLVTITIMNTLVGLATGIMAWATGLGDPLLWGSIAFLLNYVPILGPFSGVGVFVFAGLLSIDGFWQPFLPAVLYLCIHLVEGEIVTPMLLARRFTLNPVLVILSLIFWFWMWGVVGAILAVPMLAIFKIVCDGVTSLHPIGHFLEG